MPAYRRTQNKEILDLNDRIDKTILKISELSKVGTKMSNVETKVTELEARTQKNETTIKSINAIFVKPTEG